MTAGARKATSRSEYQKRIRASTAYVAAAQAFFYWDGQQLCACEPVQRRRVRAGALAVTILDRFRQPRRVSEVARALAFDPALVRRACEDLLRHGFLVPEGHSAASTPGWESWSPEATLFHFGTKDPLYASGAQLEAVEDALERECARVASLRQQTSPTNQSSIRRLPRTTPAGTFPRILHERRTWRTFSPDPLSLREFSTLLDLTFRYQKRGRTAHGEIVHFRTSPSAGARQPIDAFLAIRRVTGIQAGLYRYDPASHGLERIRRGLSRRDLGALLADQWWFRDAAAVCFFVARVESAAVRYRSARGYRFLLLDTGHLCQTFCLTATWMRLAPFSTASLADSRVEQAFRLDGVADIVLYAAGVGRRPAGGYQQWPEHAPGKPYTDPEQLVQRSRRTRR